MLKIQRQRTSCLHFLGWVVLGLTSLPTLSLRAEGAPADEKERRPQTAHHEQGTACWHRGRNGTSSGERWKAEDFMAAHRTLPFGTRVRVVDLKTGRATVVRITDRGPHTRGRIIDVTSAAAREIGLIEAGVAKVRVEVLAGEESGAAATIKPSA